MKRLEIDGQPLEENQLAVKIRVKNIIGPSMSLRFFVVDCRGQPQASHNIPEGGWEVEVRSEDIILFGPITDSRID